MLFNKSSDIGARSCGSIFSGPSYPCAFSSASNHGLVWNVSAYLGSAKNKSIGIHVADLPHVLEKFFTGPTWKSGRVSKCGESGRVQVLPPVIIILLAASDAQGAIDTTGSTQEPSSTELDLSAVDSFHRRRDEIPVEFGIEILAPPSDHVDIFKILVVRTGLDHKNSSIGVFGKSSCDHAARCSSATSSVNAEL